MTVTLGCALVCQVLSLALLRIRLGRTWLRRPVPLLVITSVAYQGLSPLLLMSPSVAHDDIAVRGIAPSYSASAALLLSGAMLALACGYLIAARPATITRAVSLDWRWPALCALPLAIVTYAGRGYNGSGLSIGNGAGTTATLASTFLVLLVTLASLGFLLRRGTRWYLPVLAAQSLLLAAAGERTPVVAAAVALSACLASCGARIPRRQAVTAVALTAVTVLALTGARTVQGRAIYRTDTGIRERISVLGSGIGGIGSGSGLAAQAASRLDGVSFAAAILEARHVGQPLLPASGVPDSLLIAVPSALWPGKHSASSLNPVGDEISDFGLQDINFLPGLPGMYAGFLSPPWLIILMALLGLLGGWGERWLYRHWSAPRLVMLCGALSAALLYEQGLPGILVCLRAAVAVAGGLVLINGVRRRFTLAARPAMTAQRLPARDSR